MPYLLDINTVIRYLDASLPSQAMKRLDAIVDFEPIISIVTKMEALGYRFKSADEQAIVETFIYNCNVVELTNNIV